MLLSEPSKDTESNTSLIEQIRNQTSVAFHLLIIFNAGLTVMSLFISSFTFQIFAISLLVASTIFSSVFHRVYAFGHVDELTNILLKISKGETVQDIPSSRFGELRALTDAVIQHQSQTLRLIRETQILSQSLNKDITEVITDVKRSQNSVQQTFYNVSSLSDTISASQSSFIDSSDSIEDFSGYIQTLLNEIRDIRNAITSIAKQTNMLALNASIEAAKAGGIHERGFSVVAINIQKLVDQIHRAVNRLDGLEKNIATHTASIATNLSTGLNSFQEVIFTNREYIDRITQELASLSRFLENFNKAIIDIQHASREFRTLI